MITFKEWLIDETWETVYIAESAHEKAKLFQNILVQKKDESWICHKLKQLDRKRKRIFRQERRSFKWRKLNKLLNFL